MRTHTPYYARSEYHTQLANVRFDEIFDITAGVVFSLWTVLGELRRGRLPPTHFGSAHARSIQGCIACIMGVGLYVSEGCT